MIARIALATAAAAAVSVLPAQARDLPPGSITHRNSQYWTWAGPRNWLSADGAYAITITSGNGLMSIDRGFNTTICATGNTVQESVTAFFAQQRATLRQSLAANWRRARLDAGRIRQLPESGYGQLYFRQTVGVSGRSQGRGFAGIVEYDYSLASGPTYCYQRSTSRVAPAAGFRRSMRQLNSVIGSLAYFGPGAPDEVPERRPA